jgi:hypothetical protein
MPPRLTLVWRFRAYLDCHNCWRAALRANEAQIHFWQRVLATTLGREPCIALAPSWIEIGKFHGALDVPAVLTIA